MGSGNDQKDEEAYDKARNRAPLQQRSEAGIISHMDGNILRWRIDEQRFFFCHPNSSLLR